MSINAVFRVQCDGPCKGWLSRREGYVLGTEIQPEDEVVAPTAERAFNWPGERAARTAALAAGWTASGWSRPGTAWLCPKCALNPLGIVLPPDPVCVCTHPQSQHNLRGLCVAVPGVLGCGCLGFLREAQK